MEPRICPLIEINGEALSQRARLVARDAAVAVLIRVLQTLDRHVLEVGEVVARRVSSAAWRDDVTALAICLYPLSLRGALPIFLHKVLRARRQRTQIRERP